jgi:hypothetical protein
VGACQFRGARTSGAGCLEGSQCDSAYCKILDANACGACAPFAQQGADCSTDECAPGLACNDNGQCATPVAVGMPCAEDKPCRVGAYCKGGTCTAQATMAGAACADEGACDGLKGLLCDPGTKKCAAAKLANPGELCEGPTAGFCQAGSECSDAAGGMARCSAVVKDGEACGPGKSCLLPATCTDGTCRVFAASMCN